MLSVWSAAGVGPSAAAAVGWHGLPAHAAWRNRHRRPHSPGQVHIQSVRTSPDWIWHTHRVEREGLWMWGTLRWLLTSVGWGCRDARAPAFLLEVRLGRLKVRSHPSLVDWGGAGRGGMMSADGWAAAARHRRRSLAATRMYVQVGVTMAVAPHAELSGVYVAMLHQLVPVAAGLKIATRWPCRVDELQAHQHLQVLVEAEEAARSRRLALSSESLTVDLRCATGCSVWTQRILALISHRKSLNNQPVSRVARSLLCTICSRLLVTGYGFENGHKALWLASGRAVAARWAYGTASLARQVLPRLRKACRLMTV
jgi:hypothetical protein